MEEENAENKGFKISDRRFSVRGYEDEESPASGDEGQLLSPDAADEEISPQTGAVSSGPDEVMEPEQAPPPEVPHPQAEERAQPPDDEGDEDEEEDKSFEMLIAIVQQNALAAMGIHPQTGERIGAADPRSSKIFVDLFAALKEKTEGNLSPEEEQLLNQVHSDLQMIYVREVGFG
ncbi:MAG: DUF1844 domain-containing protein [Nitrospinae bacterium]|nr:DUF1844 domain-containing protein [Nitrospinota bacterium]